MSQDGNGNHGEERATIGVVGVCLRSFMDINYITRAMINKLGRQYITRTRVIPAQQKGPGQD